MRITKKIRGQAADCCGVLANTPDAWNWHCDDFCAGIDVFNLAWDAFTAVRKYYLGERWVFHSSSDALRFMAEAEAMLRTGWVP